MLTYNATVNGTPVQLGTMTRQTYRDFPVNNIDQHVVAGPVLATVICREDQFSELCMLLGCRVSLVVEGVAGTHDALLVDLFTENDSRRPDIPSTPSAVVPDDGIHLLRTMILHRDAVRAGLQRITHDLERRALRHDLSKMYADEFAGFSRINRAARENPYGSPEYKEGLAREKPTVELHYSRNTHHPEYHSQRLTDITRHHYEKAEQMTLLDLIEMVCDWRGAWVGYGSQGPWMANIETQYCRYKDWFTTGQWWVINQMAVLLDTEEV